MATFVCPECAHKQSVSDEHAGKRTKCPRCGIPGQIESAAALVPTPSPMADLPESHVVWRCSGGSIRTSLSRTIVLNKESTLEREFITVIEKAMPVCLTGCVGVTTAYEPETDYSVGHYVYSAQYAIKALDEIAAFEIRFLLFDIWGRHVQTLSATEIADIPANAVRRCDSKWELLSENEACEYYASIAYVATARTSSGMVVEADNAAVVAEAKKFSGKFVDADLEPKVRPR